MWLSAEGDFIGRIITADKKEHFKMTKELFHPEDKTVLIVYAFKNRPSKYKKNLT